jgi:folate-binding protein YgfZ
MVLSMSNPEIVELLATGKAFADLTSWRKVAVSGTDAFDWLNDLVSADISDLAPGRARRSLLLSRTGAIQAEFTVAVPGGSLLLIQDPSQASVQEILDRYVLSSDVELEDRTDQLALFSYPGRTSEPDAPGTAFSLPSALGAGVDLVALAEDHQPTLSRLSKVHPVASPEDVEAWRIGAGIPRLGLDILDGDLPQEAGLMDEVSLHKGCYLGQEAVAKLQNLGRPRRLVVAFESDGPVAPGNRLLSNGEEAGQVTSAAGLGGLARVRWASREGPWVSAGGTDVALRSRQEVAPR